MRLFSYVKARYEDQVYSGVPRFDHDIRAVFPGIISVTSPPDDLVPEEDVVITDNHLSLGIPNAVRTIVVHHGSAQTHWDRDPGWRTPGTAELCKEQSLMFSLPNRWYVAPSAWALEQFQGKHGNAPVEVIPHWVKPFGPARERPPRRPLVIGDWRDSNKGAGIYEKIRGKMKDVDFEPLNFTPTEKEEFYLKADAYLCLSVSEGAPFAVADAEAARLRIVTTDVGFVREFEGMTVFPWQKRNDPDVAAFHLRAALKKVRSRESYFERYTFDEWATRWRSLVSRVIGADTVERASSAWPKPSPEALNKSVAVSLASGIGNAIFALPLLKALKASGYRVIAIIDTDIPTESLWRRCVYVDQVVPAGDRVPFADHLLAGPMCGGRFRPTMRGRWRDPSNYNKPEWEIFLELAARLGWRGAKPDVTGWCDGLDAGKVEKKYDIGVIPGCKPGDLWARKRYPKMVEAASALAGAGYSVAWFGTDADRPPKMSCGEDLFGAFSLERLPEALASCRVILGTDSGPAQIAASLGLPTVMVFTATSPVKGDPVGPMVKKLYRALECSPCQSTPRWKRCEDWICQDIPVADVVLAVNDFMKEALACR